VGQSAVSDQCREWLWEYRVARLTLPFGICSEQAETATKGQGLQAAIDW